MTKQQFLDTINALASAGESYCYTEKLRNDAYEREYGARVPAWDIVYFFFIECVEKDHNTPLVWGDWVFRRHRTTEYYNFSMPANGTHGTFAAELGTRYTAGETGVTITYTNTGKSLFVAYADISSITYRWAQSPMRCGPNDIGSRAYWPREHVGFLRVTPAVLEMDLTQAVWLPGTYSPGVIL